MSDNPGGDEPGFTNFPVRFLEPGVFPLTSTTTTLNILRGHDFGQEIVCPHQCFLAFVTPLENQNGTQQCRFARRVSFSIGWFLGFQPLIFRGFMFYCNLRKKHIIFPWKSTWPTPRKKYHPYFLGDGVGGWTAWISMNLWTLNQRHGWINMMFRRLNHGRRIWWWESVAGGGAPEPWPWFRVHGFQGSFQMVSFAVRWGRFPKLKVKKKKLYAPLSCRNAPKRSGHLSPSQYDAFTQTTRKSTSNTPSPGFAMFMFLLLLRHWVHSCQKSRDVSCCFCWQFCHYFTSCLLQALQKAPHPVVLLR